jgi:hypothetical protein
MAKVYGGNGKSWLLFCIGVIRSCSVCQVLCLCTRVLGGDGGAMQHNMVVFKINSVNCCRDTKSPIDVVW